MREPVGGTAAHGSRGRGLDRRGAVAGAALNALGWYALALGLTLLVEVPLTWAYAVRRLGVPLWHAFGVAVAVNLVTHPLLTLALGLAPTRATWLAGEALVVVVEGALFAWLWPLRRSVTPWVVSAAANLASIGVGLLLFGPPLP